MLFLMPTLPTFPQFGFLPHHTPIPSPKPTPLRTPTPTPTPQLQVITTVSATAITGNNTADPGVDVQSGEAVAHAHATTIINGRTIDFFDILRRIF